MSLEFSNSQFRSCELNTLPVACVQWAKLQLKALCLDTDQIKDLHHSSWSPSSADSVFRGRGHLNNMCLCINPPPTCAWPWGNCPSIESRAFLPLQLSPAPAATGALWMLEGRCWFCVDQSWWCRGLWEIINYCVRAAPGADGDLCWQKLCPHKVLRAGPSLCLSHLSGQGILMQTEPAEASTDLAFSANPSIFSGDRRTWHHDLKLTFLEMIWAQHALIDSVIRKAMQLLISN